MKIWKYRHYKWTIGEVIGIAKHTETWDDMVVYKHYEHEWQEETTLRTRPKKIFEEHVVVDGKEVKRFEYIGE